jgi:hypothetical protein
MQIVPEEQILRHRPRSGIRQADVMNYIRAVNDGLEQMLEIPLCLRLIRKWGPNCWS